MKIKSLLLLFLAAVGVRCAGAMPQLPKMKSRNHSAADAETE